MAASQPLGEDEMSPVRFLIAGVQKCGTSALDAYLRGHPELEMARIKETHFFDNEVDVDWRTPDYAALHSLYDGDGSAMRGEATPITFYWTPAHYRVLRYNPDMKFILLFRDPVERAWSHWKMAAAAGRDTCSFSDAIRSGRVRVLDDGGPAGLSRWLSYVERGYYARQLHELTRLFPLENMLFLMQDELSRTPDYAALHSLYDGNGSAMRGEATPITFYWTPAHYRVLRYNPDMKFILLFRDPVERAWSHWKMAAAAGRDTCSFSAAIRSGRVRVLDDGGPAGLSRWLSYVERGYYARQLHELTRLFPLENMLFLKQDELSRTPDLALARVADFLKVAPFKSTPAIKVHTSAWLEGEMMNESDRSYLTELYADDSASFGELTGIRF